MNEITIRFIESLITISYFILAVTTVMIAMKYIGKYFTKIANVCMISVPVIGIIGGWIEWIITGNSTNLAITNFAETLAVFAIAMYVLAFFSYIFFNSEIQEDTKEVIK